MNHSNQPTTKQQQVQDRAQDAQRMSDRQVQAALEACGAVRTGHFKLTSGLHSNTYIQCARVLEHPRLTGELAREAVCRLPQNLDVDVVAAPAVGGILFGFALAHALDTTFIFCERVEGAMALRRSFEIPRGARVLVCEDVVTTGGSVKELLQLVKDAGGSVVAVVSLVDRGQKPDFGTAYYPLVTIAAPSWAPDDCALCKNGEELSAPGSRCLAKTASKPYYGC